MQRLFPRISERKIVTWCDACMIVGWLVHLPNSSPNCIWLVNRRATNITSPVDVSLWFLLSKTSACSKKARSLSLWPTSQRLRKVDQRYFKMLEVRLTPLSPFFLFFLDICTFNILCVLFVIFKLLYFAHCIKLFGFQAATMSIN